LMRYINLRLLTYLQTSQSTDAVQVQYQILKTNSTNSRRLTEQTPGSNTAYTTTNRT